ncbi:MAG: dihydroorotate dehydrogenase electron transfer subunit [Methanobacteriaceae archaeon]|nr:dihydroorotate dehydrogenase electron transfer subunit [Methanobacteriaceae archaeon]
MNFPQVIKINRIIEETPTVKTFIFPWEVTDETPGQFLMLWNFADEKPMSISIIDPVNDEIGVSVKMVGTFTKSLHKLQENDKLGLRGPYGNGFEIAGSRVLAVGGGIGMAPISAFTEEASRRGVEVDVVTAATTKGEILFQERLEITGANVLPTTDDGSHGFCGFATELAEKLIKNEDYDMMVVCGPEIMMKKLFAISNRYQLPGQFSLERYMKCALGICGQCCVDDVGWRICVEGPVLWTDQLKMVTEFGNYRRDSSGIKKTF